MRLPVAESEYCLRFSAGSFVLASLAHLLLGALMSRTAPKDGAVLLVPLLLLVPYLVLAMVTWIIRTPWVLWLVAVVLILSEASVLSAYLSSTSSTAGLGVPMFSLLASCALVLFAPMVLMARLLFRRLLR
jgi:hypothetical protein